MTCEYHYGFAQCRMQFGPRCDDSSEPEIMDAEQDAETLSILLLDVLQNRSISRRIHLFGPVAERQTQRT